MKNISYLLLFFITLNTHSQINESWNLNIDSYTHSTTNYSTLNPPIEIAEFSNNDRAILTQNGRFLKINKNGLIEWQKKLATCSRQRIIIDSNDNIILSCENKISCFDSFGVLKWEKDFKSIFNKEYQTIDALVSDSSNTIYLVGHFFHSKQIFQLAINEKGIVLWKNKFNQNVKDKNSFISPKEIILFDDKIYILAFDYSKSNTFIYSSNLNGKKSKEIQISYKIKKIKSDNEYLITIGHFNNLNDKLIYTKFDKELNVITKSEYNLPRNLDYEKSIRTTSSAIPNTKEDFEKDYITSYEINDFIILDSNNLLLVGNSSEEQWITNLNLNSGLTLNWHKNDDRYFNFKNKSSFHNYSIYSIIKNKNNYLISGICTEEDYQESKFIIYINLFTREISID